MPASHGGVRNHASAIQPGCGPSSLVPSLRIQLEHSCSTDCEPPSASAGRYVTMEEASRHQIVAVEEHFLDREFAAHAGERLRSQSLTDRLQDFGTVRLREMDEAV